MAALSFDALLRALKRGDPDPVYYLHGEEDVLKPRRCAPGGSRRRAWITRFQRGPARGGDLDAEALHALLNTPPMLSERRAVVLRGVEQLRKKSKPRDALLAYLERPSPATLLVLVQSDDEAPEAELTKHATTVCVEACRPSGRFAGWRTPRERELSIEPAAAELLVAALGPDLGALRQELDKLAVLIRGAPPARDISALVGVRHGETLRISSTRRSRAIRRARHGSWSASSPNRG
jgi:DNA polymerase-3 subunit delta